MAQAHGMEYKDLSEGVVHACKLVGQGREVIFFAELRNVLIDGTYDLLARPVRWDGESLLVPKEAQEMLLGRLGKPSGSPAPVRNLTVRRSGRVKVVIDPGHGGYKPGASYGGVKEKDINLDIARRLAAHLRARGVEVILTREKDVHVSLSDRVRIANRQRPDLFLSIHANAEVSRSQHGAMSLYPDDGTRDGRPGLFGRAKRAVQSNSLRPERLGSGGPVGRAAMLTVAFATFETYRVRSIVAASHIQEALAPVTGCVRRANGVIEDFRGLRVLRGTQAPAVLAERLTDFMSLIFLTFLGIFSLRQAVFPIVAAVVGTRIRIFQ